KQLDECERLLRAPLHEQMVASDSNQESHLGGGKVKTVKTVKKGQSVPSLFTFNQFTACSHCLMNVSPLMEHLRARSLHPVTRKADTLLNAARPPKFFIYFVIVSTY